MENTVEQILVHHLTAFGNNDLDAIVADYTDTLHSEPILAIIQDIYM